MTHRSKLATLGMLVGLLSTACNVKPGDYRIYRVAFQQEELEANCYAAGFDPNTVEDLSSLFDAATIAVFASDNDTYFLEFGADTLTGSRSGNDYSFAGDKVDVEIVNPDPRVKVTTTTHIETDISLKGKELFGAYTRTISTVCSDGKEPGDNCGSAGFGFSQCTAHGQYFGSWVKDADLDYGIEGAGGAP